VAKATNAIVPSTSVGKAVCVAKGGRVGSAIAPRCGELDPKNILTDHAQLALMLLLASEAVPAGKAGYLETGLSGLREHGGKTYSS
jgi:hypothetical protein